MGFGKLLGQVATLGIGTPFAGFFAETGYNTIKALWPRQGKGNRDSAGKAALEAEFSAGSTINVIPRRQQVPAVAGRHVVTPAAVAPAFTEIVQGFKVDTYQLFALQGPHALKNIYINGALSTTFASDELEIETRQGFDADTALTLIDRNVFEDVFDEVLPDFRLTQGSTNLVLTQSPPTDSKPTWVTHGSKPDGDEIWVDLDLPSLFRDGTSLNMTAILGRMRLKGSSTWRNLPEMRIRGQFAERRRYRIKFVFAADPGGLNSADWTDYTFPAIIWNELRDFFLNYQSSGWLADDYFGTHEGVTSAAPGGSNTEHYDASDAVCTFYLDPDDATDPWPKGEYEIAFKRGYGGRTGNPATNGNTYHEVEGTTGLWRLSDNGTRTIPEQSEIIWHSISTVRNESPINGDNYALIAVKTRNMQLNSITVDAQGLTDDLVGGSWVALQETSNPASWARRLRTDSRLAYAMPDAIRSDVDFEVWHAKCAAEGLEFNMVVENNMTISALFGVICEAGYAHPRYGATEGVWLDFDRSADEIEGILTPHNSANFAMAKPFSEIPEAFALSWYDSTKNYQPAPERILYRSGFSAATTNLKRQTLFSPGKVTAAEVDEWGTRKLKAMAGRTVAYQVEIDWEHLQWDVGALVGIAWNAVGWVYQSGIVESVQTSGGNVTGVTLREKLEVSKILASGWAASHPSVLDNPWSGVTEIGLGIRYDDGSVVRHKITNTTDSKVIEFDTPFAIPDPSPSVWESVNVWAMPSIWTEILKRGTSVWAGPFGAEETRAILTAVDGQDKMRATLTLVDEAPGIHP